MECTRICQNKAEWHQNETEWTRMVLEYTEMSRSGNETGMNRNVLSWNWKGQNVIFQLSGLFFNFHMEAAEAFHVLPWIFLYILTGLWCNNQSQWSWAHARKPQKLIIVVVCALVFQGLIAFSILVLSDYWSERSEVSCLAIIHEFKVLRWSQSSLNRLKYTKGQKIKQKEV